MSRDSIDPLDEFQFRPLTEGLGFHRKDINAKTELEVDDPLQLSTKQFKAHGLDLIDDDISPTDFRSPLPRPKQKPFSEEEKLSPTSSAVDEILKNLGPKKKFDFQQAQQEFKAAKASMAPRVQTSGLQKTNISLSAAILDGMLVTAGTLLGFIILLTVTQIDLLANLTHPQDMSIYLATFSVFFGVTVIYYLMTRVFMGCTAGEWAYDQQLGTEVDRKDLTYAPLIIIRTCITMLTGIVVLPLLSKIFRRDLVGQFVGLELYRNH